MTFTNDYKKSASGTYYVSNATIYTNNKTIDKSIVDISGHPASTVYLYTNNISSSLKSVDFRLNHDETELGWIGVDINPSGIGSQFYKKN